MFGFQGYTLKFEIESSILLVRLFLDSSMVEHAAVNRGVVGSSPTRGVFKIWLHGQAVKTSPFHGGNTGSIPVGVIYARKSVSRCGSIGRAADL